MSKTVEEEEGCTESKSFDHRDSSAGEGEGRSRTSSFESDAGDIQEVGCS